MIPVLPYGTPLEGQAASDWAVAILDAMGAPVTEANVYSLAGWFLREGGGGQNNPMNTTLGSQYPAINSVGVRDFPTPEIGVQETVATLMNGYGAVVASFRAGVGLEHPDSTTAIELRLWSGGGYDAITPVVVPMPAPPPKPEPSFHYELYDDTVIDLPFGRNSERNVVRNYDEQRRRVPRYLVSIGKVGINIRFLERRLRHNMAAAPRDDERFHRGFRLRGLHDRGRFRVVKPS
jgi:hypothetical protein